MAPRQPTTRQVTASPRWNLSELPYLETGLSAVTGEGTCPSAPYSGKGPLLQLCLCHWNVIHICLHTEEHGKMLLDHWGFRGRKRTKPLLPEAMHLTV